MGRGQVQYDDDGGGLAGCLVTFGSVSLFIIIFVCDGYCGVIGSYGNVE